MAPRLDAAHSILRRTGVPDGWREASVGDLASIVGGGTPDRTIPTTGATEPFPGLPRPTSRRTAPSTSLQVLNPSHSRPSGIQCDLGSQGLDRILHAWDGWKHGDRRGPTDLQQPCEILVPRDERVDADFLYYLLNYGLSAFIRLSGGTTFGAITRRDIARVGFAVPPQVDEQSTVARILDAVDTALERTRAAVKRARELDHSLLHDLLETGPDPTWRAKHARPRHWIIRRVDEVADIGTGVTLGKDVGGFKSVERPYLRVANVQDGHLDLSTIKSVRVRVNEVENYRLEVGDVLMTEGGDLDKLGRGTIWEGQIPDCLHQNHIFRVRPKRELLDPTFFSLIVESDIAKRYFNRVAKRTTNLASTNKTQVRAFRFPLPPTTEEQRQIATVIKASKATIAALVNRNAALSDLKKSLMHDLLTGRVRVHKELQAAPS